MYTLNPLLRMLCAASAVGLCLLASPPGLHAQAGHAANDQPVLGQQQIIIDTDVGDDIDDAFAIAIALESPELHILGFTTTFGDTTERASLLRRLLKETGHPEIPVAAGPQTPDSIPMTQKRYAERAPLAKPGALDAVSFLDGRVSAHPGQITLVAIGPLTTVEAFIDRDPSVFRQLKQVVLMGGSIDRGYGSRFSDPANGPVHGPDAEWNIVNGIAGARKLLASGVPVVMMPLDATQLPLDEVKRGILFAHGSPLTDALALLYHQWGQQTPTLFDAMTVAYMLQPALCPTVPLRIRVDDKGYTRREPGLPNVRVCLNSDSDAFFDLLMTRLLGSK